MTKRLYSLAIASLLAIGTWADGAISSLTTWTFDGYTTETEYNGIHLWGTFSKDNTHVAQTSGTFTGSSAAWSATKILVSSSTAGADSLTFDYGVPGRLYVVYGPTSTTDGLFTVKQKTAGVDVFNTLAEVTMEGCRYTGELGVPRRAEDTYPLQEVAVNLTSEGTVSLRGSQPFCVYAIRFIPLAITAETVWTFGDFAAPTVLSGTKVYEFDGLYISGHNSDVSNQAQVLAASPAVNTTIAGEVSRRLRIAGKNNSIKASTPVPVFNSDAVALMAGQSGIITADVKGSSGNKYNMYVGGNSTQVDMTGDLQFLQQDILSASSVFISSNNGGHDIYAVKFTPEVVTAPVVNVSENVGTITEGTSNLTDVANKDIKTYYTIDGSEPTDENGTLYEGVIMASGTDITVKAYSVNTVTGVKSAVTTQTGLTLALPAKTLTVSATTGGSVTWKVSGASENTTQTSFSQGTSIEVTATATGSYMFESWTKDGAVVAKTPTYTFTLNDDVTLVANFKDMGNTVPVILTAGQSNTDGRVDATELPAELTGLSHCLWSYANAKTSPAGTFNNKVYEIGNFTAYTPTSDTGTQWAYDAVVYDQIGKQLGSDFYVIKQSKGNTGISPASGGCGLFWSANPLWISRTTSANEGGQSLLQALCDHIDASLEKIPSGKEADIKFLMWHQGEGDGNGGQGAVYYDQLKALIIHVRNHLAQKNTKYSNLPFILGGITSKSAQYRAEVEAAKQQLASEDENIYYVSADEVDENGLKSDVLHFNASGAQTFGKKVWQTIYDNNLLVGLKDGTGSSEAVPTGLEESEPIASTTYWDFSDKDAGTAYAEKTDLQGLYLHGSSSNKMTVKTTETTSVTYFDGQKVETSKALRSASGDRSKFMTYGLTAGDVVAVDRMIGLNTAGAGTFYAVIAPETQPTTDQAAREIYLLSGGEKVATVNALEAWSGSEDHTVKLKYTTDKAGTFFLTGQHPYLLYAAKFVKAGEETGGFTIKTEAVGGTITMTAPEGKTLSSTFSKGEEVTLQATADDEYEFVKWTDGDNQVLGTSPTLTLTINSDMTIKAIFKAALKPLVLSFSTAVANGETLTFATTARSLSENDGNKDSGRSDYYDITNNTAALPAAGKLSWRVPSGKSQPTLENGGIKGNAYPLAIHNLSVGDEIAVIYSGGTMKNYTPSTADVIATNDVTVAAGETFASGQILTVKSVSATDNYVVLYLDNKTTISAIYINSELPEEYATTLYVSPGGDDNNTGKSKLSPFKTLKKAQEAVVSGQTIHIMPGTYNVTSDEYMDKTSSSTWNILYRLDKDNIQYVGEVDVDGSRPVFDLNTLDVLDNKRITAFYLTASNITIKNIEVIGLKLPTMEENTQSENFRLNGATNCTLKNVAAHHGKGVGFYITGASSYNTIEDCDAYENIDDINRISNTTGRPAGENNDGFGCHVSADCPGNKFLRCRAWYNADDGFDLIRCYSVATIEDCIAYKNGYATYTNTLTGEKGLGKSGNGNGFKAGGYGMTNDETGKPHPMHVVKNSIAVDNAHGFYSNHHLGGLQFEDNRAYKNGVDYLLTNRKGEGTSDDDLTDVAGYGHLLTNNLSYGNTTVSKVIDMIDMEKSTVVGNSFTYGDGVWTNKSYTDNDFENLDISVLYEKRDADGNLPDAVFKFLKLKESDTDIETPTVTMTSSEIGKVTYQVTYPSDATLHYILPGAEEQSTIEGTVVDGKKTFTVEVTTDGELKLYAQKGNQVSTIVTIDVVLPKPTAAMTLNFVQMYKKNKDIDLSMSDASKTTRYFSQKNDEGTMEDKNGNFYDIEVSPVSSLISWREKAVAISASGLKPTSDARPFAIQGLVEGDVIRIEFIGAIYYARHSTKGDALKDITPGDAITSMMAYTISAVDEENGYVMFYPTKATTITQISINEELTSSKASKPTVSEPTENSDGSKSYTVTINKGETLYYTAPDKDGEQSVAYEDTANGAYVITVTASGSLVCWTTLAGDTEKSEVVKVTVALAADEPTEAITIHTIGDSTMSHYDQNVPAQAGMDGWGDYLQHCLKSQWATVYNWADRGEGAKSYFNGIWSKTSTDRPEFGEAIINKVNAGDYVIIQFGHNDSKAYSTEVYEEWMGKLVDAVKEKGATPIIASSICRRRFGSDGKINLLGQINSIEDTSNRVPKEAVTGDEHEYDYPYHAQQVAKAKGVEFIDVTAGTKALYESYGESKSAAFFPSGEKTHTNKLGAQTIAKVVAQLLYDGKTALMKYVNTEALTLPDKDSIDVVIESFGTDEVVTKKTIWTFNDYQAGDVIADSLACINGLYIRGKDTKDEYKILAEASDVSSVTFSDEDGTKLDVSVCAATQNANDYSSKIGTATAGRASADAFTRMLALNIGTSGHFYAKVGAAELGKQIKLVFSGVTKNTVTTDGTVADLDFKAENSGVIYLCANTPFRLYAAMFVPDPETGQPEDWNYQSVTTRSSGLWTYSNLSGENQSVPEGLTVYAVTGINADGKATLADIGSVIPAGGGFLVMGAANTDYALPSTTDEATYEGANLMVANSELRVLPVNEGSKTNYIFDGTKFVRASGSETIHEKQAYLSMETVVDELLPVIPEPECVNATVTLFDDSRKDRKVYQAVFGEKQKFYYMRPGQDVTARSQSYKAEFAESPFTVTVQNNGNFIYWTTETIDKKSYESKHDTIVVNTIAKKPTVTYMSVEDSVSIYRIVYSKGTTLHYTIRDGEEQTYTEKDTLDVSVKATGMMKVYSKNEHVVSDTTSVRAYAPTPAVLHDGIYDFTLLRNVIGADYTLTSFGYDGAVEVGGVTLNKPSAMTAKTFEGLALTAPVKGDSESAESTDWRLLNAGRLRASKSDNDKYLALMGVKQGDYLLLNYSGASVKYLPAGTAQLAEGTDTLKSQKPYRIVTAGDLLLSIPADTLNCDITAITMTSTENVEAPTIALKNDTIPNVVRIRAGKSSIGMSVSIRYTTDGSDPTTENGILSAKSPVDLTFDENAVIKAVTVSETGATSAMSVYELTLPVSPHAASVVYTMEEMLVDGQIVCDTLPVGVYNQEYSSAESVWSTKLRTDFYPLAQTNGQVSVRSGSGSLQLQSDGTRVRLTRALAVHQLGVGDEIAFVYTGDGSLWSAASAEGDEFTVNGKPAPAGTRIPSGAIIKVTKTKYSNNYVVVTPAGEKSGRVYIKSIYVNSDVPAVANIPSVELLQVVDTTAIYRFSYEEGEQLHYVLETDGEEQTGPTSGICDVEITKSTKVKAWTTRDVGDDHAVSETLSATLFAPTPAPSEEGDIDFADVGDELPADLEVTLDMSQSVTVEGEQLYKPSALTAATFDNKFAFSETNTSGKIKIRTKNLLMFAKGDDMSMALLGLKAGDIVAFDFTGAIRIANPDMLELEHVVAEASRRAETADAVMMETGIAYEVQKDGDLLLKLLLEESDVSISKMYVAEKPHRTEPTSILFATAVEEYEALEYGKTTSVYYNGKSSAQKFYRLNNDMEELPVRGKLSVEGASGELVNGGLKAGNRRVAIHGVARGDVIVMHIAEGGVTYEGHATKGDRIRVADRVLQPGDSIRSGDVIIVDSLDYLNNYVVLKLNSKAVVTAMFINSVEVENVSMPTIVDKGKNVIQITAGKSSIGMNVTTCYTIDGTEPTELNGTSGPYEQFEVKLLESGMVTIKAITYSETGVSSSTAFLVVYADKMVYGPSFLMDENGNMYDVYNAWGQKVNALQRGQLYIVNGKKVIYK